MKKLYLILILLINTSCSKQIYRSASNFSPVKFSVPLESANSVPSSLRSWAITQYYKPNVQLFYGFTAIDNDYKSTYQALYTDTLQNYWQSESFVLENDRYIHKVSDNYLAYQAPPALYQNGYTQSALSCDSDEFNLLSVLSAQANVPLHNFIFGNQISPHALSLVLQMLHISTFTFHKTQEEKFNNINAFDWSELLYLNQSRPYNQVNTMDKLTHIGRIIKSIFELIISNLYNNNIHLNTTTKLYNALLDVYQLLLTPDITQEEIITAMKNVNINNICSYANNMVSYEFLLQTQDPKLVQLYLTLLYISLMCNELQNNLQ